MALVFGGKYLLDELRGQDRYRIAFAEIDCPAPAEQTPSAFLTEVQYLNELPDRLSLLEEGLAARLARAFAKHPWVERVEQVKIEPPRRITVQLIFRKPVLAVTYEDELRAVDRHGILLPTNAVTDGLPVYPNEAKPPKGPAGTRWGDAGVEEAARKAGLG